MGNETSHFELGNPITPIIVLSVGENLWEFFVGD